MSAEDILHVVPRGDIVEHDTDEDCACGPAVRPVEMSDGAIGWVVVHHSLDGRELREAGGGLSSIPAMNYNPTMSNVVIPDPYDDDGADDGVPDVIVKNAIRCLNCGDEVESTHRHDFAACSCGKNFTDGGHDYLRRGGDSFEDISIIAPDEPRTHTLEHTDIEVVHVHHSALCAGRPCTIHNRSDHRLRGWPQMFAEGRMFRVCEHSVLHRDPDEISRKRCKKCDGCCRKENF